MAVITVDHPPVNTINADVREGLDAAIARIETDGGVEAVVLICAGKTFFSGADINEFAGPPKEEEYRALFGRLESLPIPVVAAMHGTAMGGGLEIALACHYRIATADARFGFPEVTLGVIPGAGGTQRMPRLIGVEKALELMIDARPVDADIGLSLGFIDQVITGDLRAAAIEYARSRTTDGPRPTAARGVDPATASAEILERARELARKRYPHRRAALTVVDAVAASVRLPFTNGLIYEAQLADESKGTAESKAAIHVFFAERSTRKVPGLPEGTVSTPVRKAGIVGAGTMGGGIAISFANAGIPVTVVDANGGALERGLGKIAQTYDSMFKRGRITADERTRRLSLIEGRVDLASLADADLIVEAVFEDLALKRRVFADLDSVAKPGAVLATNTSTLDVDAIADSTRRPEDVVGLHFFSPANVMPLLEVVRTTRSSPTTIRTAMEVARVLKKTPVLARVCYGFIGNRMMEGYAREAQRMVLEGATPREVDASLEDFGMAMGILAVFDMAGIDVGVKVHLANAERYPADPTYYQADAALYAAGRLGQKSATGYYAYRPGERERRDDPGAIEILRAAAERLGIAQREHAGTEIVERCLYPLMNEGFRILEEGVALRAADIDVVWTSGYGFPRWRGGPMFHAQAIGLQTLYEGIVKYREQFGPMHWQPATLLERLVRERRTLADWEAMRMRGGE